MARSLTQGWVEQGGNAVTTDGRVSTTLVQRSYPLATVSVFNAGTLVLATIFSTEAGAPLANPFVSDANGKWQFWADQGRYDIQFSGAGITAPYTYFAVEVVPSAAMLPDPGGNGFVVRTALGVTVARSLTQPAAGITITNPAGLAGNAIFALANDLAALEGLAGTGIAVRSAADTWVQRTITGTAGTITVTNGDGVAGNPTITIGANVVTNAGAGTDNAIARFDNAGNVIQNSVVIVADTSGNFTVPNNWTVTNAGTASFQLVAGGFILSSPTSGVAATVNSFTTAAQTQAAGTVNIYSVSTTYNQSGTGAGNDIRMSRQETAIGSGEHNFIRMETNVGTLRARIDRLGNYYFGGNPGIIGDSNGNEQLRFVPTAAAVNEWTFTNAATGTAPTLTITGNDANPNGRIAAKGTGRIIIPGYPFCLDSNTTPTGNVGVGVDVIYTLSILADTFADNNDYIDVNLGGTFATNDNDKRLLLTIDGQTIFDTGLLDFDGGAARNNWAISGRVIRVTATTMVSSLQITIGQFFADGAGTLSVTNGLVRAYNATPTVANLDSNAVSLVLSAEATANNDVVRNAATVTITQRV